MTISADSVKRRITSHDLYRIRFVRDPRIAPDGKRAAFVLTAVDRADNRYRSSIWLLDLEGDCQPRRLTAGPKSDGNPQWSPDGKRLAFISDRGATGEREEAAGGGKPQIWLLDLNGGEARQLTFVRGGVGDFRWSPDGQRIAFSASVVEPALEQQEEQQRKMGAGKLARNSALDIELTEAEEEGVGGGASLELPGERGGSEDTPPSPVQAEERASAVDEERDEQNKTRIITRMQHKFDGGGWLGIERNHIFLIDVPSPQQIAGLDEVLREHDLATTPRSDKDKAKRESEKRKERDPRDRSRQLTGGDFEDAQPRWSPDGQHIAFVSDREPDWDWHIAVNDIFLVSADLSGFAAGQYPEPRQLTRDHGVFFNPSFSPDGSQIACFGFADGKEAGGGRDTKLWLLDVAQGREVEPRCLSEGFNRSFGDHVGSDMREGAGDESPVWSADGRHIYATAGDYGNTNLFRIAVYDTTDEPKGASGPEEGLPIIRVISGDREVLTFSLSPDQSHILFTAADPSQPNDLFYARADGSGECRLTNINAPLLNELDLASPEPIYIQHDGVEVQGWLLKPPGFDPNKKYPMILEIHGGPHAAYGNTFHHEFQLMAARDYVVLYTNPRGSVTYGEDFATAIRNDWGNVDYKDIMALVDKALEGGYIDQTRLGVTGGSYGGFMTNWIIGHTDRFKAAATQRSLSNLATFWGTSDAGFYFGEAEFPGHPYDGDNLQWYIEHSPITYVNRMNTPLLILHSEKDYRCLIEQAEQLFIALKQRHKDVQMVRFPNESHGLSRMGQPRHRIERLERIIGWFDAKL